MKIILLAFLAGCSADGWSRVGQSVTVGAGRSVTDLGETPTSRDDWETDTVWATVQPLAFLDTAKDRAELGAARMVESRYQTLQEAPGSTLCADASEVEPAGERASGASVGGGLDVETIAGLVSGLLIAILAWVQRQRVAAGWEGLRTGKKAGEG